MATGYAIVDDSYIAKRLPPEPATTDCSVGMLIAADPFFKILDDEIRACRAFVRVPKYRRRGFRLVSIDFVDPGDVPWTHSPLGVGDPWADDGWGILGITDGTVSGELSTEDIETVAAANWNPAYSFPPAWW